MTTEERLRYYSKLKFLLFIIASVVYAIAPMVIAFNGSYGLAITGLFYGFFNSISENGNFVEQSIGLYLFWFIAGSILLSLISYICSSIDIDKGKISLKSSFLEFFNFTWFIVLNFAIMTLTNISWSLNQVSSNSIPVASIINWGITGLIMIVVYKQRRSFRQYVSQKTEKLAFFTIDNSWKFQISINVIEILLFLMMQFQIFLYLYWFFLDFLGFETLLFVFFVILSTFFGIVATIEMRKAIQSAITSPHGIIGWAATGIIISLISNILFAFWFAIIMPISVWLLFPILIYHIWGLAEIRSYLKSPDFSQRQAMFTKILTLTGGPTVDMVENLEPLPPQVPEENVEPQQIPTKLQVEVLRQYEYVGGKVRIKVKVSNPGTMGLLRVQVMLNVPDSFKLLRIEPATSSGTAGATIKIHEILPSEGKTVAFVLEPLICGKELFGGAVSGVDATGAPFAEPMALLEVEVHCPLFVRPEEANLATVQRITSNLPVKGEQAYYLPAILPPAEAFEVTKDAIGERDVKFIGITPGNEFEGTFEQVAWFYGITKIGQKRYVIKTVVSEKNKTMRIITACDDEAGCIGFLAETGASIRRALVKRGVAESEDKVIELVCEKCGTILPRAPVEGQHVQCPGCHWVWHAIDFTRQAPVPNAKTYGHYLAKKDIPLLRTPGEESSAFFRNSAQIEKIWIFDSRVMQVVYSYDFQQHLANPKAIQPLNQEVVQYLQNTPIETLEAGGTYVTLPELTHPQRLLILHVKKPLIIALLSKKRLSAQFLGAIATALDLLNELDQNSGIRGPTDVEAILESNLYISRSYFYVEPPIKNQELLQQSDLFTNPEDAEVWEDSLKLSSADCAAVLDILKMLIQEAPLNPYLVEEEL